MRTEIKEQKFDTWRHGLLDVTKKNKLMNYRKTKRATLQITSPSMTDLFKRLVINGDSISFRRQISAGDDLHLTQLFYIMDKIDASVELAEGEIRSNLNASEMNQTLKNLRSKAKLSQEEQGINILYLSFGFLHWKQKPADDYILSPLVLVPVSLELESILSPYYLKRLEEDIVINPTLEYALSSDFGIVLPEYDAQNDNLDEFLDKVNKLVSSNGWSVRKEANLGLLSFLKIVMYKDLEKYKDRIFSNPVIQAFCGDISALPPIDDSLRDYSHDLTPTIDVCQVVNADASQQDAILLSRKGASFILQGPPGTGKSQTITNIISQALADKKKVLFVSEKMAALSVVYRRLEEVGLSDFCLSLHNYKAERRAVIQDLVKTLDAPTRRVKFGVIDVLSVLEEERSQLNSYIEELNKIRQPLNTTIFSVLTELTNIDVESFFRTAEDVLSLSESLFRSRTLSLQKLADFFSENGKSIYHNPWRDTTISVVTYDIRNTIANQIPSLSAFLFGLSSSLAYLHEECGITTAWTWALFQKAVSILAKHLVVEGIEKELISKYGESLLSGAGRERVLEQNHKLTESLNDAKEIGILDVNLKDSESVAKELSVIREKEKRLQHCKDIIDRINASIPQYLQENMFGLQRSLLLVKAACVPNPVMGIWFANNQYQSTINNIKEWMILAEKVISIREKIDSAWEKGFYDVDYEELISRFQNEYTSFFKRLGGQYRSDKEKLVSLHKGDTTKLQDNDCLSALVDVKAYHEALQVFVKSTVDAPVLLGSLFKGIETDWQNALQILSDSSDVNEYVQIYGYSDSLIMYLGKPYDARIKDLEKVSGGRSVESLLSEIENELSSDHPTLSGKFSDQLQILNEEKTCLNKLVAASQEAYNLLSSYGICEFGASFELMSNKLTCLAQIASRFSDAKQETRQFFDINGIPQEALESMSELLEESYNQEEVDSQIKRLVTYVLLCDAEAFELSLSSCSQKTYRHFEEEGALEQFFSWFPENAFSDTPLSELNNHVGQCQNVEALQLWLRYASIAKECSDQGMSSYLSFVENNDVQVEEIIPVYRKSMLSKWLIDLMVQEQITCLLNFHSYAHEKIIQDFAENNIKQLQISKALLLDQLSHAKPSGMNQLVSAMDEVSLLRREAEKKRRVIPLRRLFKTIPTLLQRLKPCFMMSPLSVSYFLDSEIYKFDMVIFDEASQILPEDAIGAIYRGKQVIIAGDTKQMPPTSFFSSASKNTDDYDLDEDSDDYYPDVVSESILDEANTCLPSCTLLWHYRSKDESLISFSNKQLYNNHLITFPNPARLADRGLEYIYVPNGCYEGSGRNCNVMEARKCLSLVIDHIQKHPDRSLGIIAFSEKQQSVIEEVINDYRLKNPQCESFFDEAKDEPFFVKNLENVQGDERDTIVFSICYAKNSQGRMYQRFGPLSHDGGERRLNVAITRAKYNIKLVGSIMPTDIVIKEGTKEGVRLLREYIYYAMQNDFIAAAENDRETDEPFADHIVSVLEDMGYQCARNIGSSQYKVDIAVRSMDKQDVFIAGIECDGAQYAGTRTAKDRDVLRRNIMSSLGWNLYHVWAMAWYLNPEEEKKRLKEFLVRCADNPCETLENTNPDLLFDLDNMDDLDFSDLHHLTDYEDRSQDINTIHFDVYEYSKPWMNLRHPGEDEYALLARRIMCVVEKEHPVHKEELYHRLASTFGRQKATAPVRKTVDDCIRRRLLSRVYIKNDFVYLRDAEIKARVPKDLDDPRVIEHISPEEIQDAMCKILAFAYGLSERDLISETARQFGYARTGPKINDVLDSCCKALLTSGKIKETEGKLYCVKGAE